MSCVGKLFFAFLLCASTAQAIPFIENGDFDSPPGLSPWVSSSAMNTLVTGVGGSTAVQLKGGSFEGAITQNVSGYVAGEVFDLTFDAHAPISGRNRAGVGVRIFDGKSPIPLVDRRLELEASNNEFRSYRLAGLSVPQSGTFETTFRNQSGGLDFTLDNIAFVAPATGVPEIAAAAGAAPFAVMLVGMFLLEDRRRTSPANQ
jgi:hypothetical protein